MTLDEYFSGYDHSRQLFEALNRAVTEIAPAKLRITRSQIAFVKEKAFAWAWIPGKYLHGKTAPLVLTLVLPFRDPSPRWKEIIEPSPGKFTHHLEIYSANDINEEVQQWLKGALSFRG